jgi:phospholipase C
MSRRESTPSPLERREFLRRAGLLAGAAVIGGTGAARPSRSGRAPVAARTSVLDAGAADAPFDTVVVVVMENRSFDHMLGWTGTDAAYLEAGRRRYGADFHIDGNQKQTFVDAQGHEAGCCPRRPPR